MPDRQRAWERTAAVQVIPPPGSYNDGTKVYLRVDKDAAGDAWPLAGYDIECNDWRCSMDPKHDYVKAENSHNAFVDARWIIDRGVPPTALTVVRLAHQQAEP